MSQTLFSSLSSSTGPTAGQTLHAAIAQHLRERILDGRYPPLSKVPSEQQLCQRYGVSRITVRHALAGLQNEGLIFKLQGKGSFVAKAPPTQDASWLRGLAEALSSQGHVVTNEVRHLALGAADARVAQRLNVSVGDAITEVQRVRWIDGQAVSLEVSSLPARFFPVLQAADLRHRDLFDVLEHDAGVRLGHAELTVEACLADAALAAVLPLRPGAAVLRIERLTHDTTGQPLDDEYLLYRVEAFRYRFRTDRAPRPLNSLTETCPHDA